MAKYWYLGIGGIAGTFARYALAGFIHRFTRTDFPYGTLGVNLSGCFLIGLFWALSEQKFLLSPNARVLLMTGFCGAFTTFSTLILETANLLQDGEFLRASINIFASVAAGFIVFRAGIFAGGLF